MAAAKTGLPLVTSYADAKKERPWQAELFETMPGREGAEHPYTNSFAIFDLAPRFEHREVQREGGKYLPIVEKPYKFNDVDYVLTIRPARIKTDKRSAGIEKPVEREIEIYPGIREELVEKALIRIAIEKRRTQMIEGSAGVRFSLYELRKELARVGHSLPLDDIKEAIEVCHLSNVEIKLAGEGRPLASASIFPVRMVNEVQSNGDVVSFVTFNPLVTEAIERADYRLLNYDISMKLKTVVGRWLHKRLTHSYIQANAAGDGYTINASTIMRDSGMGDYVRSRDAYRTIERAMTDLKEVNVIMFFRSVVVRGPRGRIDDVKYTLTPHPNFASDQKTANYMHRKVVDLASARPGSGVAALPPKAPKEANGQQQRRLFATTPMPKPRMR